MATKKTIQDMLTFFTNLGYRMPGPLEEITDSWMHVFSRYSDDQLRPAVFSCADEVMKFPIPAEIISRIKALSPQLEMYEYHETRIHCSKCGKWAYCRKDTNHPNYECEDCYTGLNREQRRQRWKDLIAKMGWGPREAKKGAEAA